MSHPRLSRRPRRLPTVLLERPTVVIVVFRRFASESHFRQMRHHRLHRLRLRLVSMLRPSELCEALMGRKSCEESHLPSLPLLLLVVRRCRLRREEISLRPLLPLSGRHLGRAAGLPFCLERSLHRLSLQESRRRAKLRRKKTKKRESRFRRRAHLTRPLRLQTRFYRVGEIESEESSIETKF